MKTTAICLALYGVAATLAAAEFKPAAGVPDYAGVTYENFFEKVMPAATNPAGDYAAPALAPGKAFIVDADGIGGQPDDANAGTLDKPFRTLGRALREVKPGVTILLRRGLYPVGGLVLDGAAGQKGTGEQPAVIGSFPGEIATLNNSPALTNWTQLKGTPVFVHELEAPLDRKSAVWVDGRLLPCERRLRKSMGEEAYAKDGSCKPMSAEMPVTLAGAWAADEKRLYLRAPKDADPRGLRVECNNGKAPSLALQKSAWVIFNRLAFSRHASAVVAFGSPYIVFRECRFDNSLYAVTYFGGDAAERGIVDRCMFYRNGDRTTGESIYTTSPMTVRHSLFVDLYPLISVCAYTSKADGFSGLRVIGNTFVNGGACITSTGRGALIKDNLALGSRFVSSAGSDAVIEGNLAVYDPSDMAMFPATPRRNIGMRMYVVGTNAHLLNNTFIGFEQGALINKPHEGAAHVEIRGNQFHGFSDYALRVSDPAIMRCDDNLYAPAGSNASPVYLTPDQTNKVHLTFAEWRAKGFDGKSRQETVPAPEIPSVLRPAR